MSFPLVVVNTLAIFAGAMILACWLCTLIPIHHAGMKTIVRVPLAAGLFAAVLHRLAAEDPSAWSALVLLALVALATNFLLAYVYGFVKWRRFDEDDVKLGVGRFPPVLMVWTASLAYLFVTALVNLWATGNPVPFVGAI